MPEVLTHPTTADILREMLTERTGVGLCDSGGTPTYDEQGRYVGSQHGYGRHYERNQHRDFDGEPASVLSFDYREISVTHNVYHWLLERVEYDPDLQDRFDAFVEGREDTYWLRDMEEFPEHLRDAGHSVTGLYGDGDPFTVNTYNGEDLLSQTLQYLYLEIDGEAFVLIQIHGGCDVRGGYTAPRAFRLIDDGAYLLCNSDARIYCEPRSDDVPGQLELNGEPVPSPDAHWWSTDDGCHWYDDGCCGYSAGTQLEQHDRRDIDSPDEWEPGVLCVDGDGNGYCPKCGGRLAASW